MSKRTYTDYLPRARKGQRLTAQTWNRVIERVNDALRPPRQLAPQFPDDENRWLTAPILGRERWQGKIYDPAVETPDENTAYVEVTNTTVLRFRPPPGEIKEGDQWLLYVPNDTVPSDFTKLSEFDADIPGIEGPNQFGVYTVRATQT